MDSRPFGDQRDRAAGDPGALDEALDEALASIHDRGAAPARGTVDARWLGIGLRLGLERPGHARHLLELLGATGAPGGDLVAQDADAALGPGSEPAADPGAGPVPVPSMLLARSAALTPAQVVTLGPDVVFGWAAELSAEQVLRIGRTVEDMLAGGATADLAKGLGLAWDGGARIPRPDRTMLFERFTDLEVAVASILAGRDLRSVEPAKAHGFGAFAQLFGTRQTGPSAAGAAIDTAGDPGRRGLVALWNTWIAMRYRPTVPAATFELVVRPWVIVVGPLPHA